MHAPLPSRLRAVAGRLRADQDGNVIIYVTVASALLLGIVGLALDSSRALITHSEAQAAADAAALAGASQLDTQTGACARAKTEATAVANRQRFAEGGGADITIASGSPVCLSDLPSSDSAATTGFVTTSDTASRYVQVTTQQLTHQNTFLAALTTNNTATIQRTAVAGFRRALCASSPVLMNCDTFTWTSGVAFDAWINDASRKGFISACGPSANCIHDTLATAQPAFCVSDNSLTPEPGNNTNKAADGINTRFGQGSTTDEPSDTDVTDFRPYSNDITGGTGWNCSGYFAAKHASGTANYLAPPAGCTANTTSVTRYSVYQTERATGKIPSPGPAGKTAPEERRLLYVAIFNCTSGVAPEAFLKAFMLTPAVPGSSKNIWVEAIGLATSKTDPTAIHEEVQLYR